MNKATRVIGIGCIGSGVGQSIIHSCRLSRLPITTVGLGTNPFAFGAYECDRMDHVPIIYDPAFIDSLIDKCRTHGIELLIPGMDDEVLVYARHREQLAQAGIQTVVSDEPLVALTREKERMCEELNKIAPLFVQSRDKAGIRDALRSGALTFPLLAKPRDGFASRGIRILLDESDLEGVGAEHIIQELAMPRRDDPNRDAYMRQIEKRINPQIAEISIQLVADRDGRLLGRMASYNKLQNGIPIEIVPVDPPEVWEAMDLLYPPLRDMGLRGPINIQGRLTDQGLKLFEINARFTGITGLRAIMGFNEVEACIRNWLDIDATLPPLRINARRFGIRQTADKGLSLSRSERVRTLHKRLNPAAAPERPVLLLTGSTGYLGRHLLHALHAQGTHELWTLDRDKTRAADLAAGLDGVVCHHHADLANGNLSLGHVDVLVHCAFARPHRGPAALAESLAFTQNLLTRAVQHQVPAVLNASSQTVYGLSRPPLWSEDLPPAPESPYGLAKWSTELMLSCAATHCPAMRATSLRMATLTGGADGLDEIDVLSKLVRQALEGQALTVVDGRQRFTRLDLRDAVAGLLALLAMPPGEWKSLYNLDAPEGHSLPDLAGRVAALVAARTGRPPVEVRLSETVLDREQGMTTDRMANDTGWQTQYSLDDTIGSLVDYLRPPQPVS